MMDRRSMLKGLSLLSLTTAFNYMPRFSASPPQKGSVQTQSLQVYFHGLFAYIFNPVTQMIELYPPTVKMPGHSHVYRSGSWTPPPCKHLAAHEPDLLQGETYMLHLEGYTGDGSFPELPYDSAVCMSMSSLLLNRSLSFCSILLPQTTNLKPARRVKRQDGQSIFMGNAVNDYNINPGTLARTFVLTYESTDPFEPVLLNKYEKPVWRPRYSDDALHFFAEPPNTTVL